MSCVLAILSPTSAQAQQADLNLNITEASYQSFREAILETEYVRHGYAQAPKPRVIGAVAGLLQFATRNPLASDAQLTAFLTEYDTRLASHAPGDPDLQRGSHLVSAVRFELPIAGLASLDGTDSSLGRAVAEFLGIDVPPAFEYSENERRVVRFEQARSRALAESSAWASLLILGFSGQDLVGGSHPGLSSVLTTYLTGEGYAPAPPGCLPACTDVVGDALAAALPVDYSTYQARLADPFSTGGIWDVTTASFDGVNQASIDRLAELTTLMDAEPSLVEAATNAQDSVYVMQRETAYLANLGEVASERAIINMNAMLLAQSPDASTRALGDKAQRLASIQVSQNKGLAATIEGVRLVGGASGFAFALAKKKTDPVALARTSTDAITGALGLGAIFGGGDDVLLDQMVAMRQQLVEMQFQLNGRFDRIERQLNTVYTALFDGFDFLGAQIGELQTNLANANATLEDLERDLAQANASLDRIEDALWNIGDAVLQSDLALITNDVLNYRASNSFDLFYSATTPNFVTGMSNLYTFATDTAVIEVYAGDDPSTMTVASAATQLNGSSIGRQINDLRVFPTILGQSVLLNRRVAAPSLWARSAGTFAQVARENPWYFAFQYEGQLLGAGTPEIDNIIDVGADLDALAANARNDVLFDTIFDAWRAELDFVLDTIDALELTQPVSVGSIDLSRSSRKVVVQGNLAFVAADPFPASGGDGGLMIFDVSDAAAPALIGSLATTTVAYGVAVDGDLALLAEVGFGLRVIDVSAPTGPTLAGSLAMPSGTAVDVSVEGDRAFVVAGAGLQVVDIGDPTTPVIVGGVVTSEVSCSDASIQGGLAFVTCGSRLYVIDISDHAAPLVVSSVALAGAPWDLATSGDLAYVTAPTPGIMQAIDVSDPAAPAVVGSLPVSLAQGVAAFGDRAFVGSPSGLLVVDVSDPTTPVIDHTVPTTAVFQYDIEASGGFAYVGGTAGIATLEIVQLSHWPDVLEELDTAPALATVQANLVGYQNLVEAYITLGMPELMEESTLVRAALRADATVGELAVGPVRDVVRGLANPSVIGTEVQLPILANLQRLQDEVDAALLNPSVGHGFVQFMLAELNHLRDNAFELAVDDAYYTAEEEPSAIPVEAGLLANDVDQGFRDIRVDVPFALDPANGPQHGSLTLFADGSFDYTPDTDFVGTDSFTYRTLTRIDSGTPSACGDPFTICSDPATVRIEVPEPGLLWQVLWGGGLLALLGRRRGH